MEVKGRYQHSDKLSSFDFVLIHSHLDYTIAASAVIGTDKNCSMIRYSSF